MKQTNQIKKLVKSLESQDPETRIKTAQKLSESKMSDEFILEKLMLMAESDDNKDVRQAAEGSRNILETLAREQEKQTERLLKDLED